MSDAPTPKPMFIEKPLVIMFRAPDGSVVCHLHAAEGYDHRAYGLLTCDLVRHVASAFNVDESDVWEWVDKERDRPSTTVTRPS